MSHELRRKRMEQAKEFGRIAGRNGTSKDRNPYKGASLHNEHAAWEAGHSEGEAQRKAGVKR